jgi:hypothetical protein
MPRGPRWIVVRRLGAAARRSPRFFAMENGSRESHDFGTSARRKKTARAFARGPTPLSNALLVAATVFVVIGAAELLFRAFYHPENLDSVVRFDDVLGWSLEPRASLRSVDNDEGLDYRIRTNSLGMRDREVEREKKPGTKRILIVGDSIAFGTGVDAEWRFSDFLSRALGDDVEVLNAGVCGWGTDQELLYYETKGRDLRPDIVILAFTMANDVLNNMLDHLFLASAPKPRFVLEGDSLVLEKRTLDPPRPGVERRVRSVLRKSRVLLFAKRRIDAIRYESRVKHEGSPSHRGFDKEGLEKNYSHWSVYEASYPPQFEAAWRVTEALIARLARDCANDGADFLVFAFPLKLAVDEEWRSGLIRHFSLDPSRFDFEKPHDRLSEFCAAQGVRYLYPLDVFREASSTRSLYFDRDTHPTMRGHAVAAGVLLRELHDRAGLEYRVAEADRDLMYPQPVPTAAFESEETGRSHN